MLLLCILLEVSTWAPVLTYGETVGRAFGSTDIWTQPDLVKERHAR